MRNHVVEPIVVVFGGGGGGFNIEHLVYYVNIHPNRIPVYNVLLFYPELQASTMGK